MDPRGPAGADLLHHSEFDSVFLGFSRDGFQVVIADVNSQNQGFWHCQVFRMVDGRLFTMFWTALLNENLDSQGLYRCMGTSDGTEWSEPEPTDIPGQTNHAVDLGEGRMLDLYTRRDGSRPGFYAVLSANE